MATLKLMDYTLGSANKNFFAVRYGKLAHDVIFGSIDAGSDYIEIGSLVCKEHNDETAEFNSMLQANSRIEDKKKDVIYGVGIKTDAFSLLNSLTERDPDGVDYIRLIFGKSDMAKALEYGRIVVEKGYILLVHPLCSDQYTYSQMKDCATLFAVLSPAVFFIDDSFGVCTACEVENISKLLDEALTTDTAIGFHGRECLYGMSELLDTVVDNVLSHDLVIDATLGCESRIFDFSCDAIARWANKRTEKKYDAGKYISLEERLRNALEAPNYSHLRERLFLTAKYRCNPLWAWLSVFAKFPLFDEEFRLFISQIPDAKKLEVDEESYKATVQKWIQPLWNKKLAVIVPTANRSKSVEYYLQMVGETYEFLGVDLFFYDSSSDNKTERVIENFTKNEYKHIIHERYTGGFDGITIDEKGTTAYDVFSQRYEYVWMTRDGWIIDVFAIREKLLECFVKKPDAIVLYSHGEDEYNIGYKEYHDCAELFYDSCCHMTILGSTIFSSEFMKKVVKNQPLGETNYGMWQPIAMFHQWGSGPFFAISCTAHYYFHDKYATRVSFWNKNGKALWQWAENWYTLIHNLPSVYDKYKSAVYKFHIVGFCPFQFEELLIMRTTSSLTWKKVTYYSKYLVQVSDYSLRRFYAICLIPKFICRAMLNPKNVFGRFMMRIADDVSVLSKESFVPSALSERYDLSKLDAARKNNDVVFAQNKLCIVLLAEGNVDALRENLDKSLQQYEGYNINVVVFDKSSSPNIKETIENTYASQHKNVYYKPFIGQKGLLADDEMVIEAYKECSAKYEYIWIMRDTDVVDLNICAFRIWDAAEKGKDLIGFTDENASATTCENCCDPVELFRDTFCDFVKNGRIIAKRDLVNRVLAEQPLGESNMGLWQPMAFYAFFAQHPFDAALIGTDVFYHPSSSLYMSCMQDNLIWRWAERLHAVLSVLPRVYQKERKNVLLKWNSKLCGLHPLTLLNARIAGNLSVADAIKYGKKVREVSGLKYSRLIRISLMPKWIAKVSASQPQSLMRKYGIDEQRIGEFKNESKKP